jgi:hypothetical protein
LTQSPERLHASFFGNCLLLFDDLDITHENAMSQSDRLQGAALNQAEKANSTYTKYPS